MRKTTVEEYPFTLSGGAAGAGVEARSCRLVRAPFDSALRAPLRVNDALHGERGDA